MRNLQDRLREWVEEDQSGDQWDTHPSEQTLMTAAADELDSISNEVHSLRQQLTEARRLVTAERERAKDADALIVAYLADAQEARAALSAERERSMSAVLELEKVNEELQAERDAHARTRKQLELTLAGKDGHV